MWRIKKSSKFRSAVHERAVRYIQENYQQDISLECVAQYVYVNQFYLSHLFTKIQGRSFKAYLTHLRMEHAQDLLLKTNLKISEVAAGVGYNNTCYFSHVFNRNFGCTPTVFRQNYPRVSRE